MIHGLKQFLSSITSEKWIRRMQGGWLLRVAVWRWTNAYTILNLSASPDHFQHQTHQESLQKAATPLQGFLPDPVGYLQSSQLCPTSHSLRCWRETWRQAEEWGSGFATVPLLFLNFQGRSFCLRDLEKSERFDRSREPGWMMVTDWLRKSGDQEVWLGDTIDHDVPKQTIWIFWETKKSLSGRHI